MKIGEKVMVLCTECKYFDIPTHPFASSGIVRCMQKQFIAVISENTKEFVKFLNTKRDCEAYKEWEDNDGS